MNTVAATFLANLHPYSALSEAAQDDMLAHVRLMDLAAGETVYKLGEPLTGIYVIVSGTVAITDINNVQVSRLETGNTFGERGFLKDGSAATTAKTEDPTRLMCIPGAYFSQLLDQHPPIKRFFNRSGQAEDRVQGHKSDLATMRIADLMASDPITCSGSTTILEAAQMMRDNRISSLCVMEGDALTGIVTVRDLTNKALAEALPSDTPVSQVMTAGPKTLPPTAIGSDVLHLMMEHAWGHLPIVDAGRLVGIVTQTDLTRHQAATSAGVIAAAAHAENAQDLARITARIPRLLVHLVASGNRHDIVTRLITDVADVVTRRLLALAEAKFGPPPVPYVWLACGSQGRQEQTGVSDQDNCLMIDDSVDASDLGYFEDFATFVSDGLHACGYVYCPGDMMATNPRWRQPVAVWRDYFKSWIASPSKEAQMLASVMFDLRPIGGRAELFEGVQTETLAAASKNSIFTSHMASNATTHGTPLGLLRGFVTIRSGEHRNTIDMKHNGVVPVVDLGRMYALQGKLQVVNTRARLEAAMSAGIVSPGGGRDLLDAYDLIAQSRLEHQAKSIKAGAAPDNFLPPAALSDFERSHLRDAFVVVKTMQAALMQGRGVLG
ncbi:DUF294 nucleotidyltransferase-like domain-containing protein [Litoreibacter roseus]|uniref:Histidine kinase n=1 Tax=Litoreibacter roseus TaxID=2601869 RepID=A0A6N6JAL9_9RHOB|nr:DUF294 nucleotidyltransferase-like domain-containing protein [Litoreibacter roseus]GFE62930.1 histidine kinase [Litoreibacter roseus]